MWLHTLVHQHLFEARRTNRMTKNNSHAIKDSKVNVYNSATTEEKKGMLRLIAGD